MNLFADRSLLGFEQNQQLISRKAAGVVSVYTQDESLMNEALFHRSLEQSHFCLSSSLAESLQPSVSRRASCYDYTD